MWPFGKAVDELNADDLRALIPGVRENRMLDYKQCAYSDTWEIVKDVSSFANASGGYIIIGISEDDEAADGTPKELFGIAKGDVELQRILSACHASIDPPIVGFRVVEVPIADAKVALVLSIPNSANKPHMVKQRDRRDFYCRHERQTVQMSVDEIHESVLRMQSVSQRVEEYVHRNENDARDCAEGIVLSESGRPSTRESGDTRPLAPMLWMFAMPQFVGQERIDVLSKDCSEFFRQLPRQSTRYNPAERQRDPQPTFEGIERRSGQDDDPCLTRILRTGFIDHVDLAIARPHKEFGLCIFPSTLAMAVYWWSRVAFEFAAAFMSGESMFIGVRLLRVIDTTLYFDEMGPSRRSNRFRRGEIRVPESRVSSEGEFRNVARTVMTRIVNAYGHKEATDFDQEGNLLSTQWIPRPGEKPFRPIISWEPKSSVK